MGTHTTTRTSPMLPICSRIVFTLLVALHAAASCRMGPDVKSSCTKHVVQPTVLNRIRKLPLTGGVPFVGSPTLYVGVDPALVELYVPIRNPGHHIH